MSIKTLSKIDIHHPHDSFFKKAMEDPKVVRDFLKAHLHKDTLVCIDLDYLELQSRMHNKQVGKQHASDIVYKTKINSEEGYLYFAIEHQSHNDRMMAFRLLRYVVEIMETALVSSKKLPLVIPVVIYHGKGECKMEADIRNLIAAPRELINQYWLQPFQLIDLTKIKDQELAEHQFASLMELALKSTYHPENLFYVKKIIEVYKGYRGEGRELDIQIVLEYLFVSNRKVGHQQFVDMVHEALPEDEDNQMLTIAEQCVEEGRQEGYKKAKLEMKTIAEQCVEEGRQEGRQEGYKKAQSEIRSSLLARGVDPKLIEEVLGYSRETAES